MNKETFLSLLEDSLNKRNIHDVEEVIFEYKMHIEESLSKGVSEEQIVKSLGDVYSISDDYGQYQKQRKNRRLFDIITSSIYAIPLLIILYAISIVFFASSLVSWSLGIYYIFQLSTFTFLPTLLTGINFVYGFMFIAFSFLLFSIAMKSWAFSKGMSKQYYVKSQIRIGQYYVSHFYSKLFKISLYGFSILFILSLVISMIVSKSWGFWHEWHWFD